MVTQSDVAKKAGVSFITVSRVINNSSAVKSETREKVLKAIKELHYYPNNFAQGLSTGKTRTVGLAVPLTSHLFSTPYYVDLLSSMERALAEFNYYLLFYPQKHESNRIDYIKLFYERKVDGLIIIAPKINDPLIKEIDRHNIPCIIIDNSITSKNILCIDSDNIKGGFLATEYLIKKNHSRIAFISGSLDVRNGHDRFKGFKRALKKYDIPFNEKLVRYGDFSQSDGYNLMKSLLEFEPSAVFAANDMMAIGAIHAITESHLNVPDDISIIGFDDIELCNYITPQLTTIHQFSEKIGYDAIKLLIQKIANKSVYGQTIIQNVQLVERQSVIKKVL